MGGLTPTDLQCQFLKLAFVRCLDAAKLEWSIVAIPIDVTLEQVVKMYIQAQGGTESLCQCHSAGGAILQSQSSLVDQVG
ncbi:MAG: hypothetical protein O2981_04780 [Proteobacteria bacterium]|nr:hypothetical protein [Pseudomonadota bacterium]